MAFNREPEVDLDQAAAYLKDAYNKVMTEENPDLLNDLKKVFKKTIPFSKRMYVAAYLVKEAQGKFHGSRPAAGGRGDRLPRDSRSGRNDRADRPQRDARSDRPQRDVKVQKDVRTETSSEEPRTDEHTPRPRVQIDEALAATIFISIGRNRRVYPRDLVGLLISVAGLDRDRIGDIRVLANYSFVQLFKDDTEKAITALNGYDYRGRKLVVSYSRQKGDEEPDDAADSPVPAGESAAPNTVAPAAAEVDPQTAAEDAKAYAAAERAAANKEPFTDPAHVSEEGTAPASDKGNGFLV